MEEYLGKGSKLHNLVPRSFSRFMELGFVHLLPVVIAELVGMWLVTVGMRSVCRRYMVGMWSIIIWSVCGRYRGDDVVGNVGIWSFYGRYAVGMW